MESFWITYTMDLVKGDFDDKFVYNTILLNQGFTVYQFKWIRFDDQIISMWSRYEYVVQVLD